MHKVKMKLLQNFSIILLSCIELMLFLAFFIDINKITIIDSNNIISWKSIILLIPPIVLMVINAVLNKCTKSKMKLISGFTKIKSEIPNILLVICITFFVIRNLVISYFIVNEHNINGNNRQFNQTILAGSIILIICIGLFVWYKNRKIVKKENYLLVSIAQFGFELDVLLFLLLIMEVIIYLNIGNKTLFNISYFGGLSIILLIKIIKPFGLLNFKVYLFLKEVRFFRILQTFIVSFIICMLIILRLNISVNNYPGALLVISTSGLFTVILYWSNFRKVLGDNYFAFIMLIEFLLPIILYLVYYQTRILDEHTFTNFMFGVILAIGAILLLVVGEDSQLLNGVSITRQLNNYEKRQIAKYRMRISNGVIIATFMNVLFSKISDFINWIATFFKGMNTRWMLVIAIVLAIAGIGIGSFILTKIEVNAFRHFQSKK
jgi:hypothetical protein